jgi:hypothetical protein
MNRYGFFTSNEIAPRGWLRKQLEIQANGLSGNLDRVWRDVRDSAWIGGDADGWERVPYWLDGFIPLAYLLNDDDMKARAARYIDSILANQKPDGWLCPCTDDERGKYDLWALFLICKVLTVYCDCSGDERIPAVLGRALRNLYDLLKDGTVRLSRWGKYRWFECMISIMWLKKRTGEEWLDELASIVAGQGADYSAMTEQWKIPINEWTMETHIVNLCMMLKYEAVSCELLKNDYAGVAERLWRVLDEYNGTAVGTFTGDECLSGLSPIQGTELCSVAELMYSCEHLYAYEGNGVWMDRLEKAAFNALPATFSEDMWTHQYDQMVNQIECVSFPGKSVFRTNGADSHIFGLEPNYGCCTANFNQAWPKLALSTFYRSADGIVSAVLAPSEVSTEINGVGVTVALDTLYPFRDTLKYTVAASSPVEFELKVRIPGWCRGVLVDGREYSELKDGAVSLRRVWNGTQTVELTLRRDVVLAARPNGLSAVEYGPLVFALPIESAWEKLEYTRDGVERKYPYCDYNVRRRSDWSYGFAGSTFEIVEQPGKGIPFSESEPMLRIKAKLQPIAWGLEDGYRSVCAKYPQSTEPTGEAREMFLIPYGCTKLRMTEMPLLPRK